MVQFQYGMATGRRSLAVAEDILNCASRPQRHLLQQRIGVELVRCRRRRRRASRQLKIVGFDSSPTLIEDWQAGAIDSLVVQNPSRMGYAAVKALIDKLNGKVPEKRIDTGAPS